MRNNFSKKTKTTLASRVAYRCSFPGCGRITIGPGTDNNEHVITIGEAAHIYAAAPKGPRNNPNLTPNQLKAIDNGIWMCNSHARLIDIDEINYSAETLINWKTNAENYVRERLVTLDKEVLPPPLTLVMLNINLILQCEWLSVEEETWKFKIHSFIEGSITDLRMYIGKYSELNEWDRYIVIESQGDGRMALSLSLEELNDYTLCAKLHPKLPRTNPHNVGIDIALGDDGDIILANGDLQSVSGIDCALQIIQSNLSWEFGWWANPYMGSNFSTIYKKYNQSEKMLNSMAKLELIRLMTVPTPKGVLGNSTAPELNFINRLNWVRVQKYDNNKPFLPIQISLEWGNNENWEGVLKIPFALDKSA